jgi:hypothetical protein
VRRTLICTAVILSAILGSTLLGLSQGANRIPVFVKAAASAGGFTDPSKERQDSVKDIVEKVRGSKVLSVASSESEALLILEVLARGTHREVNGLAILSGTAQNKSRLEVRLTAGEYSTDFAADGGSSGVFTGYGKAAGSVVKQVEAWAKDNRQRLLAIKK